jgi:low density lipoprotein-related protein 2
LLVGDLHGRNFRILAESKNRGIVMGVDFHYQKHRVFWTDPMQAKVTRKFKGIAYGPNGT